MTDFFLSNSYPSVLFESWSHVINHESHVLFVKFGENLPRSFVHFLNFWNLPRFSREISKFQKSELGFCFISCIVYWIHFQNIHTLCISKNITFIHLCRLFLESSKALFSVSLSKLDLQILASNKNEAVYLRFLRTNIWSWSWCLRDLNLSCLIKLCY